jgi:hypothetical protein
MDLLEHPGDRFFDLEDLGDALLAIDPAGETHCLARGRAVRLQGEAARPSSRIRELPARGLGVIVIDFDPDAFGFWASLNRVAGVEDARLLLPDRNDHD